MPKKIPMRQCVGCREMKPKKELIRVVRSPEGQVSLDFRGKLPGRGAYVCPNPACLAKAKKSKALERAFSAPLPEEVYRALEEQMKEDASVVYFQASEGGFSGLTGDESFYLNQDGSLVVVFDEYTVAPGSMGMVEFTIPTETAGAFR